MFRAIELKKVKKGEFVRRKIDTSKTYTRGDYVRRDFSGPAGFQLNDVDDIGRSIVLKGSTLVWIGFTY